MNKCPACHVAITSVEIEGIDVTQGLQTLWKGVSFGCPHCHIVLSVGIDPIALKTDLVQEILDALGHGDT